MLSYNGSLLKINILGGVISFPGSLPHIPVIKVLFDFLLFKNMFFTWCLQNEYSYQEYSTLLVGSQNFNRMFQPAALFLSFEFNIPQAGLKISNLYWPFTR